ncbi:hypothetical protein TI39_contig4165g00006 [Zymoseptoria brevis]|uniref:Tat pathway signal sequence like protein n=1 Tax=Zymoseptoria brevis TaxID=1047168 RepID=A0A0F4GCF1_9PEZI|nr:hypothetical protein TI39_contig4165g00006 [Zymoseptoria brevis]
MAASSGSKRRAKDSNEDEDSPLFEAEVTPKRLRVHRSEDNDRSDSDSNGDDACDDDGGESDSDDGKNYDESVEPYPAHAAYDEEVEEVKFALTLLAMEAEKLFAKASCDTPDVRELRGKIEDVKTVPEYKRITIGLLGEAGEGKSSLVSSLADCPGLAKALEAGASCTYVITEYTRAVPNQRKEFSATIECYNLETAGSILSSALDDWAFFHQNKNDNAQGWSQEDHEYHENKSLTSLAIFRAIFSKVDLFCTDETAIASLHRMTDMEMSREEIMAVMLDNTKKALDAFEGLEQQQDGKYMGYFEADSTAKLWARLDRHITESAADGEPAHWPLVKKVTIGVAHSRLLDKVSLVDMPGISDTNQVRVDTTLQHINNCDQLFIVARIGRIVTNTAVNMLLKQYGKAFRGNIAVVVTRCDDGIDDACAMEMVKHGLDISGFNALKASSELMSAQITELRTRRNKCRSRKSQARRGKLTEEIDSAVRNRQEIENTRWGLIADFRNQRIIRDLTNARGRHMPPKKKLKVFCVSNKHYAYHKSGEEYSKFLLSPNGTGIPQLRQQTLLLAAPRILGAIEDYIDHRFKVFLRGYELWSNTKAILTKERDALLELVEQPRRGLSDNLEQYQRGLQEQVEKQVVGPMRKEQENFAEHATNMLQSKIRPLHHSTIGAFVRRKGNFKKSIASDSWNTLFTEKSTENLMESWEFFLPRQVEVAEKGEEQVISGVLELMKKLKDRPAAVALPIKAFEEALEGRIVAIRQHFKARQEIVQRALRKTYLDATVESEDNFFAAAMAQAYELCKNDKGKGVKARSIGRLDAYLALDGEHSPYARMAVAIADDIEDAVTTQTEGMAEDLTTIFNLITKDFRTMTKKKGNDPSEVPVRDAIKAYLQTAGPKFDGACKQMEEIKSRYPADT